MLVSIRLTVDIEFDADSEDLSDQKLAANAERVVQNCMGEGRFTSNSNATVEAWECKAEVVTKGI